MKPADVGLLLALLLFALTRTPFSFIDYHPGMVLLLVLIPSAYIRLSHGSFSDYNIGFGDARRGLKYSAVLLLAAMPFMYYGAGLAEFGEYYPLWKVEKESVVSFLYYEVVVMGVVMFYTEFFYRGFLLQSLMGWTKYGNLVHSLLYMYVHLGKPGLEVWWSLPAGYVFGEVDMRCRSILPSFLMHWLSSLVFTAMIIYL